MRTHRQIDERSLELARAIAARIDADPEHAGLHKARAITERWMMQSSSPAIAEWHRILKKSWHDVRVVLLDPGENGQRLRQSNPFCGILTQQERMAIFRRYMDS